MKGKKGSENKGREEEEEEKRREEKRREEKRRGGERWNLRGQRGVCLHLSGVSHVCNRN